MQNTEKKPKVILSTNGGNHLLEEISRDEDISDRLNKVNNLHAFLKQESEKSSNDSKAKKTSKQSTDSAVIEQYSEEDGDQTKKNNLDGTSISNNNPDDYLTIEDYDPHDANLYYQLSRDTEEEYYRKGLEHRQSNGDAFYSKRNSKAFSTRSDRESPSMIQSFKSKMFNNNKVEPGFHVRNNDEYEEESGGCFSSCFPKKKY